VNAWIVLLPILAPLAVQIHPGGTPSLSEEALAARAEAEFDEGVRLRQTSREARGHFRAAALAFEELRQRGVHNPLLYRNLGNAWFLAGDLARAIRAYREGLWLAPADRVLRERLKQAREQVVYPSGTSLGQPPEEVRPDWLPRLPPGWAAGLAALVYVLGWVFVTRWGMVRRGGLLILGSGLLILAGGLAGWEWYEQEDPPDRLVVVKVDGVLLRKGNGLSYPPRYETPVNRGVEARLLFERDGWLQIELAGGEVGWIPRRYALTGSDE
jgi:hypothetical protein